MLASLGNLPDEILHSILRCSNPWSTAALEQTARRFRDLINEPLLWRFYCRKYFQFWDDRHEISKKLDLPVASVDWKELYISRHRVDRATSRLLNAIITSQTGRIEKFHEVIQYGYDVKDTLYRHLLEAPIKDDYLARRYYAKALITCLHRNMAVSQWARLRDGEPVSLERALGSFDLFVSGTEFGAMDKISSKLNEIVVQLKEQCPNIENLTAREKALAVASFLRSMNLTGIDQGREYDSLEHNFLGIALSDPEHNSLPLVSAVIYCHIAQSVGLQAHPCGFPFHVHVIIRPLPGFDLDGNALDEGKFGDPMYMDPFRSDKETRLSDLQSQLNFLGATTAEQSAFLEESLTSEIVLRCSRNILHSTRLAAMTVASGRVDMTSARYGALWAFMLFTGQSRPDDVRHRLPYLMETFATEFPYDLYLVEQYIVPLFQGLTEQENLVETLHVMRAVDEIPKQIRTRGPQHANVSHRIGQVIRHRRYHYTAIITGWDTECRAGEQWMAQMGVDRLESGRHQTFYHVLVEDGSVRYVAEENIRIIAPKVTELPATLMAAAGKYFKRWDGDSQAFVSNIRDEYPGD